MQDEDGDGKINFKEFKKIHDAFPQLLYPAFRMQEAMMETSLGATWWRNKRAQLARSPHTTIAAKQQDTATNEYRVCCCDVHVAGLHY